MPAATAYRRIGWLLTIAWGSFVFFRRLLREGMWGDGLTYAAISRNMAIGKGSFWSPIFATSFWLPYNQTEIFYEHPPLMFYIQSWFFRLLGDTYITERVYCLVVLVVIIILMVQLWRQFIPVSDPLHRWEWLPVFVLFTFPLTEWTYAQNYLDATMSLFCLLTVRFTVEGWRNSKLSFIMAVPAILALFAAFLVKGPVGLHALTVPGLYWLLFDRHRPLKIGYAIRWTLILVGGFALLFSLLMLYEPARIFLQTYFNQQVWAALIGKREAFGNTSGPYGRFFIVRSLLLNSAPAVMLTGVLWVLTRFRSIPHALISPPWPMIRFWVGLGLAATLPIMATTKQIQYYIVPAMPYMALGLAGLVGSLLLKLTLTWSMGDHVLRIAMAIGWLSCLVTGLYGISIAGTLYHTHRDVIVDVKKMGLIVPLGSKLGVCPEMMASMQLHSYIQRYYRMEMTTLAAKPDYFLADQSCMDAQNGQLSKAGYQPVNVSLKSYFLYHHRTVR